MDEYVLQEYRMALEALEPLIAKYELDPVMLSSIVRGTVEVEEHPLQSALKVWKSKDGKVYTIKPSNIKINLSFALDNAFRFKTIFTQKDIWLVLAIIHLVVDMFTSAVKRVDEMSALILVAVFRLQSAESREILEYAQKILPQNSELCVDDVSVQRALDNLEELKCVKLENGKYSVIETVGSSLYSYAEVEK